MAISIHEARLKDLTLHPESISKDELSEIFHHLWTKDVGTPEYNKDMWKVLDVILFGGKYIQY
tara:strand:- start:759 stop:947 length:189 start_codon:yes stop_codon:yes gene_type:complete